MATLNLGRIKPVFRGAYSGSTAYVVDDIVTHGNESFICIQAHGAGTQATSVTAYWTKLAAKGTDGTDVGTTITTQGDILFRDGSGLQRLAKGTAAQTLKMNSGATAPEWATVAAPSQSFEKLGQGSFSAVSSVSINGLSTYFGSTPTDYKVHYLLFDYVQSTNNDLYIRQMTSDSADNSAVYSSMSMRNNSNNAGPHVSITQADTAMRVTADGVRSTDQSKHSMLFQITNMTNTASNFDYLQMSCSTSHLNNDGVMNLHGTLFRGCTSGNNAINTNRTGLHFYPSGGNFTGTWRVWGLKT